MRAGIFVVSAVLVAVVAGAGVAFAQSDWVVDPWATPPAAPTPSSAEPLLQAGLNVRIQWVDEGDAELDDPWVGAAPRARAAERVSPEPPPASRITGAPGEWAKPVPLLVDPWAPEPAKPWVPPADLIVDPWAQDGSAR